jgi:hypothetical protein
VDFESTRVLSAMEKYDKIYNKIRIFWVNYVCSFICVGDIC